MDDLVFNSQQVQEWNIFSPQPRSPRPRGPPSLISNGYRKHLPVSNAPGVWSWPLSFI